ncbi:hypothetical protein HAX54_019460 [Datura stramonium]|uniref:Uncharacterized protein n=1 Tax=Datura stramonium TaxID=4076 RepID=A0ABS8UPE4_DATST|nr:hypothetical protein [Datura stramonium]
MRIYALIHGKIDVIIKGIEYKLILDVLEKPQDVASHHPLLLTFEVDSLAQVGSGLRLGLGLNIEVSGLESRIVIEVSSGSGLYPELLLQSSVGSASGRGSGPTLDRTWIHVKIIIFV